MELSAGTVVAGVVLAIVIYRVAYHRPIGRWIPVPVALVLGVGVAAVAPTLLAELSGVWTEAGLPQVMTGGAAFIGVWSALLTGTVFLPRGWTTGRKIAIAAIAGLAASLAIPPVIDTLTGQYQTASLRADMNRCTQGMLGQVQPTRVTNTCDEDIVVGLCLPGEVNPEPCAQSRRIAPGETAGFDPGEARVSSVPGDPNGLTVVACRPPDRPSRWGNATGRGYQGVCLPPA